MRRRKPIVDLLRQRSRPYLFSNALPPPVVGAAIQAIDIAERAMNCATGLFDNARRFRVAMSKFGFNLLPGEHPIIPVMLGEAGWPRKWPLSSIERGIYVTGFFYPVVPQGRPASAPRCRPPIRRRISTRRPRHYGSGQGNSDLI